MSNMIIVNFGIINETNRFKQYALQSKFVQQDVLEKKFSSLPFKKGRRFHSYGSAKVLTFWGLSDREFIRKRRRFKKWYTDIKKDNYTEKGIDTTLIKGLGNDKKKEKKC